MGVVFRPDPRRAARTTRSNTAPAMPLVMRSIYDAKHPPGSGPILLPTSGRRTRRPWHRQNQPRYLLRLIQLGQICRLDAFEDFSDAGAHQAPYAGDAPAGEIGSQRTLRWRERDSNHRSRSYDRVSTVANPAPHRTPSAAGSQLVDPASPKPPPNAIAVRWPC